MMKPDRQLAEKLLNISAIKLQPDMPFVWGSGWNSPIYNDNRRLLSYPDIRNYVKTELAKNIVEHFDGVKDHGLENLIEGNLRPGHKVVMVEDIIATAGGTMKAAEVLTNAGCEVLGGVAIFNYEFPMAVKRLNNANIDMVSLCTYNVMVETALATDYIQPEDVETLKEWRKDPANWVPERSR